MAYVSNSLPRGVSGYAMSSSPTGPWEYKGMIMEPYSRSSGNHPGIIDYKGRHYVFGFNYTLNLALTSTHRERRSVAVSEFSYSADEGPRPRQLLGLEKEGGSGSWVHPIRTNKPRRVRSPGSPESRPGKVISSAFT